MRSHLLVAIAAAWLAVLLPARLPAQENAPPAAGNPFEPADDDAPATSDKPHPWSAEKTSDRVEAVRW